MSPSTNQRNRNAPVSTADIRAVVIGVSAGGLNALSTLLPMLPTNFPAPILVVQHRMATPGRSLEDLLDQKCSVRVKEAEDKETLRPGCVYLAPADYHLLVERDETVSLSIDAREHFCRPSIDVLFESAACVWSSHLIGVILTGANSDGAAGLAQIEECGGMAIVQDPNTAECDIMPRAALEATGGARILNLKEIGLFFKTEINNQQVT